MALNGVATCANSPRPATGTRALKSAAPMRSAASRSRATGSSSRPVSSDESTMPTTRAVSDANSIMVPMRCACSRARSGETVQDGVALAIFGPALVQVAHRFLLARFCHIAFLDGELVDKPLDGVVDFVRRDDAADGP